MPADLVLKHVDVAADALLQQRVAARMGERDPERRAHLGAVGQRGTPARLDRIARLERRPLPDRQRMARIEIALQRLGQPVARAALGHRAHMHLVIVALHRAAGDLADQPAQRIEPEAHADQRAMGLVRQVPEPAPARTAGRRNQRRQRQRRIAMNRAQTQRQAHEVIAHRKPLERTRHPLATACAVQPGACGSAAAPVACNLDANDSHCKPSGGAGRPTR
ncbi:hypothetical protein [Derxia lacustris]|uniref:hypothetical protein n=1 Tax=Derxia lacustris TaxID=764842 RepID=UPI002E273FB7